MYSSYQLLNIILRLFSVTCKRELEWNILLATNVNIILEIMSCFNACLNVYEWILIGMACLDWAFDDLVWVWVLFLPSGPWHTCSWAPVLTCCSTSTLVFLHCQIILSGLLLASSVLVSLPVLPVWILPGHRLPVGSETGALSLFEDLLPVLCQPPGFTHSNITVLFFSKHHATPYPTTTPETFNFSFTENDYSHSLLCWV